MRSKSRQASTWFEVRNWGLDRLLYHGALTTVILSHLLVSCPFSGTLVRPPDPLFDFFLLMAICNFPCCTSYLVDLFVQSVGQYRSCVRRSTLILAIRVALGIAFAHIAMLAMFKGGPSQ